MGMLLAGKSGEVIMGSKTMRVKNWLAGSTLDSAKPRMEGRLTVDWDDGVDAGENVAEWRAGKLVGLKLCLEEHGRFFLKVAKAVICESPGITAGDSTITLGVAWAARDGWSMPSRRR